MESSKKKNLIPNIVAKLVIISVESDRLQMVSEPLSSRKCVSEDIGP